MGHISYNSDLRGKVESQLQPPARCDKLESTHFTDDSLVKTGGHLN